jgi:hypothetical protein
MLSCRLVPEQFSRDSDPENSGLFGLGRHSEMIGGMRRKGESASQDQFSL